MKSLFLFLGWSVFLISCTGDDNLTESNLRIKDALEKRKAMYKKEIMDNCKRDMLEKATLYVDSLIAAEISYQLSDSIVFPPKPLKPTSPGPIIIRDTVKAKPVW
jgi:hypothetical protein